MTDALSLVMRIMDWNLSVLVLARVTERVVAPGSERQQQCQADGHKHQADEGAATGILAGVRQ